MVESIGALNGLGGVSKEYWELEVSVGDCCELSAWCRVGEGLEGSPRKVIGPDFLTYLQQKRFKVQISRTGADTDSL